MNEIATAGSETSVFTMFLHASIVVKLVMIGLLSASVWCWAIIINKTLLIRRARAAIKGPGIGRSAPRPWAYARVTDRAATRPAFAAKD